VPLGSEEIATKAFGSGVLGFNRREVRRFLQVVAAQYEEVARRARQQEEHINELMSRLDRVEELLLSADTIYGAAQDHLRTLEGGRDATSRSGAPDDLGLAVRLRDSWRRLGTRSPP
jgi:cell division septum initiation protein DivIVA